MKKIDETGAEAVGPETIADKTVNMVVLRDYWDATSTRVRAGTVIAMDVGAAMDGLEAGSLRRAVEADFIEAAV